MKVLMFVPEGRTVPVSLPENDVSYASCYVSCKKHNNVKWVVVDMNTAVIYDSWVYRAKPSDVVY